MLCGAPSCSEACLSFSDDSLRLWLQSVQCDLQHDFVWVTDESWSFGSSGTAAGYLSWEVWWLSTGSTGLAILLFARSCYRLSWEWWLHPFHLLGHVLLGCCRLKLTSTIVMQPSLLCEGWGGHPVCLSGDSSVLMFLHLPFDCTAQSSILSIDSVSVVLLWDIILKRSSVRHFPERSWTVSSFPCVSQWSSLSRVGMSSSCCSSSDFLYSHYIVRLSSFLFHAPLDVFVLFLVFLRSFKFESFLSWFSPFVAQIKNFCSDRFVVVVFVFLFLFVCLFFLLTMCAKGLTSDWLFQSLLCWRWWSLNLCLHLRCSWWWEVQTSRLS